MSFHYAHPRHLQGATLIEFMIANVLGLLIMVALVAIFANSSRSRAELEKSSQLISNGRSAIELMNEDIRMAGYMAEFDTTVLTSPTTLPAGDNVCPAGSGTVAFNDLRDAMMLHVQGIDNASDSGYPCLSDVKPNSDIIVVRRASTCTTADTNCQTGPFIQASLCANNTELTFSPANNAEYAAHHFLLGSTIASMSLHKQNCTTLNDIYEYLVHVYFVANNHETGDNVPTLKRAELRGSSFTIVPLVEGVEDMQVDYGLDASTPPTGVATTFTTDPATVDNWRRVVEVKLFLLMRNTQTTAGFADDRTYTISNAVTPASGVAYKRRVYSTSIRLASPAWRRVP